MDEYIEREALQAALQRKKAGAANGRYTDGWNDCLMRCKSVVSCFPAADVAPVVHGRWIPVRESEMTGWQPELAGRDPICGYVCSVCKEEATFDCNDEFVLSNYCPNCGAKMMGETHESEKQL